MSLIVVYSKGCGCCVFPRVSIEIKDGKEVYNFCGLASHNCRECLQKNKGGGR